MTDASLTGPDFERLAAAIRPRLHRYAARMVGSAFDGEDVVQDALTRALTALPATGPVAEPERWLFRITHNAAIDALRRRARLAEDAAMDPDWFTSEADAADARVAAGASLAAFLPLPILPRACVALVDVLGHTGAETATILDATLPAVKAALHRGREQLRAASESAANPAPLDPAERERLRAYADRFNARDFDALRALLAEDVRLDLANRLELKGRDNVQVYFGRYEALPEHWQVSVGLAEGRPALLFRAPSDPSGAVRHVVLLDWRDGQIALIRDFLHAGYVMDDLATVEAP